MKFSIAIILYSIPNGYFHITKLGMLGCKSTSCSRYLCQNAIENTALYCKTLFGHKFEFIQISAAAEHSREPENI